MLNKMGYLTLPKRSSSSSSRPSYSRQKGMMKGTGSSILILMMGCCLMIDLHGPFGMAQASHIMTSESKEAEFEMIHTNNGEDSEERLKKKKTNVLLAAVGTTTATGESDDKQEESSGIPSGPRPIGVPDVVIGGGDGYGGGDGMRYGIGKELDEVRLKFVTNHYR
jgi:hypothetical protein